MFLKKLLICTVHVVDCIGDQSQGSNAEIKEGRTHDVSRGLHDRQDRACEREADDCSCHSQNSGDKERCPDCFLQRSLFFGAEILRRKNSRASRESDVKHHKDSQHGPRGAAHGREGLLSGDPPDDQSIDRVVELLKKGADQQREKEEEDLLPDDPLRDGIEHYGIVG